MDNDTGTQIKQKKIIIPEHLQCPITKNGKLMLDPVMVIDGNNSFTCERDAGKNRTIVPNENTLKSIQQFIKDNTEALDLDEDLYFSESLRDELLSTMASSKDDAKFSNLLVKDDRLLVRKLKGDKTLLELVCETGTPKMIEFTLNRLKIPFQFQQTEIKALKEKVGYTEFSLFATIAHRDEFNTSEKAQILLKLTESYKWDESDFKQAINEAVDQDDSATVTELLRMGTPADDDLLLKAITYSKYEAARALTKSTVRFSSSIEAGVNLAFEKDDIEILKLFVKTTSDTNLSDLFIRAINEDKVNIIKFLLQQYKAAINPNQVLKNDVAGRNLFMLAVEKNQIDALEHMMDSKAFNIDYRDTMGNSIMHYFAQYMPLEKTARYEDIIRASLEKKLSLLKSENQDHTTPLKILQNRNPALAETVHETYRTIKQKPIYIELEKLRKTVDEQKQHIRQLENIIIQIRHSKVLPAEEMDNDLLYSSVINIDSSDAGFNVTDSPRLSASSPLPSTSNSSFTTSTTSNTPTNSSNNSTSEEKKPPQKLNQNQHQKKSNHSSFFNNKKRKNTKHYRPVQKPDNNLQTTGGTNNFGTTKN